MCDIPSIRIDSYQNLTWIQENMLVLRMKMYQRFFFLILDILNILE